MLRRPIATGEKLLEITENYPILSGVVVLILGVLLTFFYFGLVYPHKTAIYGPEGQETQATSMHMKAVSEQRSVTYLGAIEFRDAAGQSHRVEQTYDMQKFLALKDQQNAVIRCLKSDPSQAFEIHSQQAEKPNVLWYGLQCGLLLGVGTLLILIGRSQSRPDESEASHAPVPVRHRPSGRPLG